MQTITPEDSAILARYQRGDFEALNQLVERHRRRAYCYAFRLTRDAEEASDIVAEAFVRVYRSIGTFRGDSSFTTWLYRVETNCYLDMRKRASNHRNVSLDEMPALNSGPTVEHIPDGRQTPHEYVERKERISLLDRVIQQLPKKHRTILLLYHAESMTYEEIAHTLEMPIGTVKSRLNRARLQLRDMIKSLKHESSYPGARFGSKVHP